MRIIILVILLIPLQSFCQSDRYMYLDKFNFELLNIYDQKPSFSDSTINNSTIRTKYIIQDNDTIKNYIDLEIINHPNRKITRTYFEDGTLDETTTEILIAPNKVIKIIDFVDYESFERDSIIRIYNEDNQILTEHISGYSDDSLDYDYYKKYYYNQSKKLCKRESMDRYGNTNGKDTIIYNDDGSIHKLIKLDCNNKLTATQIYERNKWVQNSLYQIITYDSKNLLKSRIITPSNPSIDSNMYVLKHYSIPNEYNTTNVVKTTEYRKIPINKNGEFKIIQSSYLDHKFERENIYSYDVNNILKSVESRSIYSKSTTKCHYQYSINNEQR